MLLEGKVVSERREEFNVLVEEEGEGKALKKMKSRKSLRLDWSKVDFLFFVLLQKVM